MPPAPELDVELSVDERRRLLQLELLRRAGLASQMCFMEKILGYPEFDTVHHELEDFLIEVHRTKRRGLVLLPRGHLKSTFVTVGHVMHEIVKNPDLRVLISNASLDNSKGFLREIKLHFEKNELLKELYGDFANTDEKWSESQIIVKQRTKVLKEPTIQVTSVDKSVVSQHYDLIVGDDLVNRESIGTREQRRKSLTYYRDLLDLLEPGGTLILIGTRWHHDDLYGQIIRENETSENFMVMKRTVWKDKRRRIPLFRKFTPEYIDQLRAEKGGYEFSGQYMNEPVDDETADFQRDWINRFDLMDLEKVDHQLFITIDPALTKGEGSDYTGVVINAVTEEGKWYIVKAYRARFNPTELVDEFFSLRRMYGVRLKGFAVEKTAHLLALKPTIEAYEKKLKKNLEIVDVTTMGRHKEDRIRALVPKLERGEVFFSEYCGDLIEEMLAFPRSTHDDVLDAFAYQLDIANSIGIPKRGQTREMMMRPIKPRVQNNV